MASNESLKIFKAMIHLGYKLKVFPFYFKMDAANNSTVVLGTQRQLYVWLLCSILHILVRIILLAIGFYYDLTESGRISMIERAQYYFILAVVLLSLTLQVATLFYYDIIRDIIHCFWIFNNKLIKFHRLDSNSKDGTEIYIKALLLIIAGVTAITPLGTFICIQKDIHVMSLLKTNYALVGITIGIVVGFILFNDWLFVFIFAHQALMYTNIACRSLRLMSLRLTAHPTYIVKHKLVLLYQSHQIFHQFIMNEGKTLIGLALATSSLIMISTLLILVGYYHQVDAIFTLATGNVLLITVVVTKTCLHLATRLLLQLNFVQFFYELIKIQLRLDKKSN